MNLNLSSLVQPHGCCPPLSKPLASATLGQTATPSLGPRVDLDVKTFGPGLDGGQLPAGCFACGLAAASNLGELFLGQFFGQ